MDYTKIIKTVEALVIFVGIFLVTFSSGDGAPNWRPQGRFGKRFSSARNSDIMAALQTVADENENLEPLFMEGPDVNSNSGAINDFYNGLPSDVLSLPTRNPLIGGRICIETKVPGVFRCHRGRRSTDAVLTLQES